MHLFSPPSHGITIAFFISLLFLSFLLPDRMQCQQGKMAAFSNVLQCQRDALAKGVEIIKKTLDKYDILEDEEEC